MGLSITDKFLIDAEGKSKHYSEHADIDGIYFAEGAIAASSSQITQCNVIDKIIDDVIALNKKAVTDTYDPTSSAAMSGKAIANALSTVSADVDGTTIVKGTDGKLGLDPTLATKLSTLPDNLITGTGTADKLAVFTDTDEIGASVSITKSTDTLSNDDDSILTTKAVKNLFGDSFTETSGKYELANGVVTANKLDATLRSGIVIGAVAPLTVNASNQVELTGKVDGTHIDDKAIKASHLADDFTLSGEKLTDATVTEAKLASTFSLDGSKIKDATITEDKLASGFTLDGSKITNATITADKLTSDFKLDGSKITDKTVTETQLADKAVSTAKIADNAVTETLLANNSVTSTKLADDSVVEAKLADNAVTEDKIKDSAVTSAKLADNAVTTAKIADDAVDKTKIAADVAGDGLAQNADGSLEVSVDGSTIEISSDKLQIKNSGVTSDKIKDGAVTASKIANGNITSNKLAIGAVTTTRIADSNVTTAKVADAAITEDKLADDAVTTDKIADKAVTEDKLDSALKDTILFTTDIPLTSNIAVTTTTTGGVTTKSLDLSADAKAKLAAIPTADGTTIEESATHVFSVKDSGVTTAKIADSNVTTAKVADAAITEDKLADDAVTTDKIADAAITKDKLDSSLENVTLFTTDVPTAGALEVKTSTTSDGAGGTITTKTLDLKDKGVTTAKLDDKAVTTAKLNDKAVTNDKIADETIAPGKLTKEAQLCKEITFEFAKKATTDTLNNVKAVLKNANATYSTGFDDSILTGNEMAYGFIPNANSDSYGTVVLDLNMDSTKDPNELTGHAVNAQGIALYVNDKLYGLYGATVYKGVKSSLSDLPTGDPADTDLQYEAGWTYLLDTDIKNPDDTIKYPAGSIIIANKNWNDPGVAVGDISVWEIVTPAGNVTLPDSVPVLIVPKVENTDPTLLATVDGKKILARVEIEEESIKINQLEEDVQTVINMAAMLIEIKEPGFYLVDPDLNTGVGATTPIVYGVRVANE